MAFKSGPRRAHQPEGAPGNLGIIQAFVNTEDPREGTDKLRSPRGLADWLAGVGLLSPDAEPGDADLELARELRQSLRRLMAVHNGAPPSPGMGEVLDRVAREGQLCVRFTAEATPYVAVNASGAAEALGRLLGFVIVAQDDGLWRRLKTCADPQCAVAFYDHSKNCVAKWCTPRCCNRLNARAMRRRR